MFRLLIHLNLNFPEKGLGLVSPSNFVDNFSRKMIFMLYSSNWSNFIAWLPLLFEILGNMFTVVFIWKLLWVLKKMFLLYIHSPPLLQNKKLLWSLFSPANQTTHHCSVVYIILYILLLYIYCKTVLVWGLFSRWITNATHCL